MQNFNPRAPCGARLVTVKTGPGTYKKFQSTCPLRGTTWVGYFRMVNGTISIHVPLAGHDYEHDAQKAARQEFQSTCPLRGTTPTFRSPETDANDFNPRAPCGARRLGGLLQDGQRYDFNPRAPCGARLRSEMPLREDDDFNPRAPCGARLHDNLPDHPKIVFQSTCPLRGTTLLSSILPVVLEQFQSTCPLRGTTRLCAHLRFCQCYFNPRAPCGARHVRYYFGVSADDFNPRAPCGARLQKGTKITVHFCENRLDLRFSADSAAYQEQNRS